MYFLGCKGLSNDDIEVWQGAPYFRGYGLNLLSKQTGDFVIESWGGYRKMIPKLYMVASVSA